jgi:hypothetical protein
MSIASFTDMLQEFDSDRVRRASLEVMERSLMTATYNPDKNQALADKVVNAILQKLAPGGKSVFKYVFHCMISSRSMNGYNTFSNNSWDDQRDGIVVVDYENSDLRFALTVWGLHSR